MRTIHKELEPSSLRDWKRKNPHGQYNQLTDDIRRSIRQQALGEQFYLCAYCCQPIKDMKDCHNEHVKAQHGHPTLTLDFTNIVASCNTRNQCGTAHESQALPLTPLMPECETELKFKISGRVEGLSDRATTTIQVLNLGDHEKNNRTLVEKRKQLFNALLWKNGINPNEGLEDQELLELLINDLANLQGGKLEAFSPVLINILKNMV
jgi:uncharacterized protein (TIGR02646 family)